mmetsp:Transcript_75173/g.244435  ORF Transcript_75173/g.244435 Transcript_75173/m.244435 type:complete len:84 (+) Transcript_75173:1408-1659(+)
MGNGHRVNQTPNLNHAREPGDAITAPLADEARGSELGLAKNSGKAEIAHGVNVKEASTHKKRIQRLPSARLKIMSPGNSKQAR